MKKYFSLLLSVWCFFSGVYILNNEVSTIGSEALGKEGYRVFKRFFGDLFPGGESILYFIFSAIMIAIFIVRLMDEKNNKKD